MPGYARGDWSGCCSATRGRFAPLVGKKTRLEKGEEPQQPCYQRTFRHCSKAATDYICFFRLLLALWRSWIFIGFFLIFFTSRVTYEMPPSVVRPQVRSRKVDNRRPLPVFQAPELLDLDDSSSINRAVELSRGVDHEEESETHLQLALHTAYGQGQVAAVIPTPDASRLFPGFANFYSADYQLPISFIRFSSQVEDVIGVDYNLSVEDDQFLQTYNSAIAPSVEVTLSEDSLEELLAALEWVAAEKLTGGTPSQEEFDAYSNVERLDLAPLKPAVPAVYGYWKGRREHGGGNKPLISQLRLDEYGPKADSNPYVCFRKREIKAVRKTRRCDSQSLEKLLRLREEMRKAHRILELVVDRERKKRESLIIEHQIFHQRSLIRRLKKRLGKLSDKSDSILKKKKSKKEEPRIQAKIRIPLPNKFEDGDFDSIADTIDEKVRRKKFAEEIAGWLDFSEDPYVPVRPAQPPNSLWFQVPVNPASLLPWSSIARMGWKSLRGRHRFGRGGRVIMDRQVFRHEPTLKSHSHHSHGKFLSKNARTALEVSDEVENEFEDVIEDEVMQVEDTVP
ncbi:enhancer of polycomb-like-domain-containing protein [Cladochytrium replicatum]|nr:enhancer of polycomb-like-domain-containing protein [Cladochytrium replicatum]